ncbi:Aste57867_947 [Aphanomyces stellatus]|uniref:Aste57867_947 protein n=1 Tax=Aphanomyces stellatus TaxID=120398 RepID=A0A485K6L2_9STRA|nr:hypothetical protein As57867_000946 [Aphanomyces stellatus]VFT78170.1 Aste57867_947 [Aphanomyces stellatus]
MTTPKRALADDTMPERTTHDDDSTVDECRPVFAWSDGTVRRVPQGWVFPTSLPMKELWLKWFAGAVVNDGNMLPPFRYLDESDFDDAPSKARVAAARADMRRWLAVALELQLAPSEDAIEVMLARGGDDAFDDMFTATAHHMACDGGFEGDDDDASATITGVTTPTRVMREDDGDSSLPASPEDEEHHPAASPPHDVTIVVQDEDVHATHHDEPIRQKKRKWMAEMTPLSTVEKKRRSTRIVDSADEQRLPVVATTEET